MRETVDHPTSRTTERSTVERDPYVIASALRTLRVLHDFAEPPHRLGLADVIARLGLERNQAYRSLKTLEAAGFAVQGVDGRFELGPAVSSLAAAALQSGHASVVELAGPFLDELSRATEETIHLFVRAGDLAVCVDRRESPQSVRLVSVLGRSFPLHAGASPKAMLAWLSPAEQEGVLSRLNTLPAYTDKTVLDSKILAQELLAIRVRGHAVSDEDFDASARGVGAPILGSNGDVVAGISVGGPSFRVDDEALAHFAELVRAASGEISRRLALA